MRARHVLAFLVLATTFAVGVIAVQEEPKSDQSGHPTGHGPHETLPVDAWLAPAPRAAGKTSGASVVVRDRFTSIQVNVDQFGQNIPGDAANEPSIAIDPVDPTRIVIGWRQFDTIESDFRQAGYAYSHDGGQSWTFPGSITPGVFGSDPVLDVDSSGNFYYLSINFDEMRLFRSSDGGATWPDQFIVQETFLDKPWMAVDRTGGVGDGHIYISASSIGGVLRSIDGGATFDTNLSTQVEVASWGTVTVSADGNLFAVRSSTDVHVSYDAQNSGVDPTWSHIGDDILGGFVDIWSPPNPGGLAGQAWVAAHQLGSVSHVYVCSSIRQAGAPDSLDIRFARSLDGGSTWEPWIRINDDPPEVPAYQWFGTLAVAPNGRIDVIWNDTRESLDAKISETYYSSSFDSGKTWTPNIPITPAWDSSLGYPNQGKIGDYYHMRSDNGGAWLAFSATFNGEQDVYALRITPDCDADGVTDAEEIAAGTAEDCNGNSIADDCETDCNDNQVPDTCDISIHGMSDCDFNWVPDVCEDCNGNGLADTCDLSAGTSADCNENEIPDDCEIDCNNNENPDDCDIRDGLSTDIDTNGIPDDCQPDCNDNSVPDSVDIFTGTSSDCNSNGNPDECDVQMGISLDEDGSLAPDECECLIQPPANEAQSVVVKNRVISFSVTHSVSPIAVRVTFDDLPEPFDTLNGYSMWLRAPRTYCQNSGIAEPNGAECPSSPGQEDADFHGASLRCDPLFLDWTEVDVVHVFHEFIVPGATYAIQTLEEPCDPSGNDFSSALTVETAEWGDVTGGCELSPCSAPDGTIDITTDVTSVLDKFKNFAPSPAKFRSDLEPATIDMLVNISDVTFCLDAFRGTDYPFTPSTSTPCP